MTNLEPFYGEAAENANILYSTSENTYQDEREEAKAEREAKRKLLVEQEQELLNKLLLDKEDEEDSAPVEIHTKSDLQASDEESEKEGKPTITRKRVWEDDDEIETVKIKTNRLENKLMKHRKITTLDGQAYQNRLDEVFEETFKKPDWAITKKSSKKFVDSDDDDEADEANEDESQADQDQPKTETTNLKSQNYLQKSKTLDMTNLNIKRCTNDLGIQSTRFKATTFHPTKNIFAAIASDSRRVKLCEVDGQENKFLNGIDFGLSGNLQELSGGLKIGGGASSHRMMNQNLLNKNSKLVDLMMEEDKMYVLSNFVNKKNHNRWNSNIVRHDLVTGQNKVYKNVRGMDSLASKRFYKLAGDGLNLAMHNNQPSAAISIFNIKNDNLVLTNTFRQGSKIVDMFPFSTSSNNNCLATLSNQNEIFLWDLRYTNSCVNSIKCDDMVRSTRLAINSNGTKMAVGGHTGYVALYNFEELYFANIMAVSKQSLLDESAAGPTNNLIKPVKEFSNLTTCINSLNFVNIKGTDLLTFSSNGNWLDSDQMATTNFIKRKSSVENSTENNTSGLIKIANTNSKQIYSTFPSFKQKSEIGCLQDFKFSPGGKFLVCQNSKGKLPVFTLGHGLKY